ncbi:hypothetical protein NKH77_41055 [Streptomyces sp. M19]
MVQQPGPRPVPAAAGQRRLHPDPRAYYDQMLSSAIAPKIGESTNVGNFGRYANPPWTRPWTPSPAPPTWRSRNRTTSPSSASSSRTCR